MKTILLIKTFLGLVQMTFGLVNATFSLPEWQAVKLTFFHPALPFTAVAYVFYEIKGNFSQSSLFMTFFNAKC